MRFLNLLLLLTSIAAETVFQCDYVFDASSPRRGNFSFPILPKRPTDENEVNYNEWGKYKNLQCIYTFVAGQGKRVKLEFDQFQLAGTADNCELEYVDIYSELDQLQADLLSATLSGRYCGSVSPHVRISLNRYFVLVFHSRAGDTMRRQLRFKGRYSFIDETHFIPGVPVPGQKCSYIIDPNNHSEQKKRNYILSPTYPGTYPKNMHCSYLLRGRKGQRIRLFFRDFDLYFGGEHCPYDTLTVFDGASTGSPIIKKVCGLQQRMEIYSYGNELLLHFNSTNPSKADPRGFVIEYEISNRYVDIEQMLGAQKGVTHRRGTECDIRVESNRETTHFIQSPRYPDIYPGNTTCTFILDGLQGDQNLEKVILTFESFAVISDTSDNAVTAAQLADAAQDDLTCPHAWVGVASSETNMKATLSSNDESNFEATLCERIPTSSPQMGPYISDGPRMVVQFGTTSNTPTDGKRPLGFRAKVEFKTDFGVPGEPMGDSNQCMFRFSSSRGFFNSPRYPANYPLDTNCSYYIEGRPGEQVLIHFEAFALFKESEEDMCKDWLEIFDVFHDKDGSERLLSQAKYCAGTFPGPRLSSFGASEMRVLFSSDSSGSGNGFKALYEIRKAPLLDIPNIEEHHRCGHRIYATEERPTGYFKSPGFPVKYNKDVHCEWEINARQGYQILLNLIKMEIEGAMADALTPSCQKAVIRVFTGDQMEFCGTEPSIVKPVLSKNNSLRVSFLTAPDKVNGLKGFNFSWTEVKAVKDQHECSFDTQYMCTYSKLCISSLLRCNGDLNCGTANQHDDTDESHCELKENSADKTLIIAVIFSGGIFVFICVFFCYLFKKKLERKKKKKRSFNGTNRLRQRHPPYRLAKPAKSTIMGDASLTSPATSRFVHHDATGILPPINLQPYVANAIDHQTFYG